MAPACFIFRESAYTRGKNTERKKSHLSVSVSVIVAAAAALVFYVTKKLKPTITFVFEISD